MSSFGRQAMKWAEDLYPLKRSLVSEGYKESLSYIQSILDAPLNLHRVPSGAEVGAWKVPDSWNLRGASLRGPDGIEYIDLNSSNLHVVVGSESVSKQLPLADLIEHLHVSEGLPDAIPYVTSYYSNSWGFCLSKEVAQDLPQGLFTAEILADVYPDEMQLGELIIEGSSREEVLVATYLCHPQMANNELSGPLVWVGLANHLIKLSRAGKLRYTYRFYVGPETLGAIFYLNKFWKPEKDVVVAGFQLTCIGGTVEDIVMPARQSRTVSQQALESVMRDSNFTYRLEKFENRGSDERQWCYPGVDIPVASYMSAKYHDYPEYHTSADNLGFISEGQLERSLSVYMGAIQRIEDNRICVTNTVGEPKLDSIGLYPRVNTGGDSTPRLVRELLNILSRLDGETDLLSISLQLDVPFPELTQVVRDLEEAGFVKEISRETERSG